MIYALLIGALALAVWVAAAEFKRNQETAAKLRAAEDMVKRVEAVNAEFEARVRALIKGTPADRARAATDIIGGVPYVPPSQTNGSFPG